MHRVLKRAVLALSLSVSLLFTLSACDGPDRLRTAVFADAALPEDSARPPTDAGLPDLAYAWHPDADMPDAGDWSPTLTSTGPYPGLHIELIWNPGRPDNQADVDLHFLHPNGTLWMTPPYDCYFNNKDPIWDGSSSTSASLDHDITTGHGPENIRMLNAATREYGRAYRVGVHYYDEHYYGLSTVYLGIWCGDSMTQLGPVVLDTWELWRAADITFAGFGCDVIPLSLNGQPWVTDLNLDQSR